MSVCKPWMHFNDRAPAYADQALGSILSTEESGSQHGCNLHRDTAFPKSP